MASTEAEQTEISVPTFSEGGSQTNMAESTTILIGSASRIGSSSPTRVRAGHSRPLSPVSPLNWRGQLRYAVPPPVWRGGSSARRLDRR